MVISTGHLGQTSDKPAILVIVTEIGQLYLQKGKLMTMMNQSIQDSIQTLTLISTRDISYGCPKFQDGGLDQDSLAELVENLHKLSECYEATSDAL